MQDFSVVKERTPDVMYADRLQDIAPFRVMELMERAKHHEREGRRVVHFEVGEPDFSSPPSVLAAGQAALAAGHTKYTQALGIPALRERIARYYEEECGVSVAPDRVVITAGASGGLLLLCALLLNPEDTLLMADPGYPCNEVFARLVGGRPVRMPVSADNGFELEPAQVSDSWSASSRGLLLASPANPTGIVIARNALAALIDVVRQKQGFVILDEIYQGLIYDDVEYRSGLEVSQDLFVLNSFSKYYGMTGWRLGWMVLPDGAAAAVTPLAQNLFISPSSIAQQAALAAFEADAHAINEERRQVFRRRRDQLCDGLKSLGLHIPVVPSGAFYLYVDVSVTALSSHDFCWRLIDDYQVAVTPGTDFGVHEADRYVRFAYTTSEADIDLGLERIALALQNWKSV